MNQPYPMEILLTPGNVTIVIEAYTRKCAISTPTGARCPRIPTRSFTALRSELRKALRSFKQCSFELAQRLPVTV